MQIVNRQETEKTLPNIYARGIVAMVTFKRGGSLYQAGERKDGTLTKATRVPF